MPPEYTPGELIEHETIETTPLPRNPGWEETGHRRHDLKMSDRDLADPAITDWSTSRSMASGINFPKGRA